MALGGIGEGCEYGQNTLPEIFEEFNKIFFLSNEKLC